MTPPPEPRAVWRRWLALASLTRLYAAALLLLLIGLEWRAEYWVPLGIFLFAPALLLLAPLGILLPWALWQRAWRSVLLLAICALMVTTVFMTFRVRGAGKRGEITVITHNVGQGNRAAFKDSFPSEIPDAVLLQDVNLADKRGAEYQRRYPTYHNRGAAQFILLTPHEIESAEVVADALWHTRPIAARFVIRVGGRHVALYSVHLPTPRSSLNHALSPRLAVEVLGLHGAPTDGFASYREWLDARIVLARQLAAVFEKESLPFLVGGDFNMPDHGVLYHTFAASLTDAFPAVGQGWGFTFPGGHEGRISAFIGPWLRLDYWFAGRGWKPVDCKVANDTRSQHCAVLARFDPKP